MIMNFIKLLKLSDLLIKNRYNLILMMIDKLIKYNITSILIISDTEKICKSNFLNILIRLFLK